MRVFYKEYCYSVLFWMRGWICFFGIDLDRVICFKMFIK